jgi:hypothetical protein
MGLAYAQNPHPSTVTSTAGRFQILSLQHTSSINGTDETKPVVFKIDTQTGDVWYFFENFNSATSKLSEKWVKIDQ